MVLLKMKKAKFLVILLLISPLLIFASDINLTKDQSITISSAYYFPDHQGYELSVDVAPISYEVLEANDDTERDIGSSWGSAELQATYTLSLSQNVLTGGSPLTVDNRAKYTLETSVTPVNIEVGGNISLAPIAFLDFNIGSTLATGWQALGVTGLGINNISGETPIEDSFQGILSQSALTGTFMFDTAALLSGDTKWKHIVILSSHKLMFRYFSGADENEAWAYQGSENNLNGFKYNHTSFLGYQMPLVLEKFGFVIETDCNLFNNATLSTMDSGGWGSDFLQVRLGALFNIVFNDHHSLAIVPQFTNRPNYTDESLQNVYFGDRKIDTDDPSFIDFERVAFIYSYNL